jgi:DNA-binding NarL/FixJ family response regulator
MENINGCKPTNAADLIKVVREPQDGNAFFRPTVTARMAAQDPAAVQSSAPRHRRADMLTPRETEVLHLIAEGKASKEIAAELFISLSTVIKHRQQVMNKLNLHNIASLTRYAIAEGVVKAAPDGGWGAVLGFVSAGAR